MKIILSRKGFDSSNGGFPSPILPDGTLISFPIPAGNKTKYKLSDLYYNDLSYRDILQQLRPNAPQSDLDFHCHLDPDIRGGLRRTEKWMPAFGQVGGSQTHLDNQGVAVGDLFLFFGWFKQTEYGLDDKLRYVKGAPDLQIIYGYLQIGEILKSNHITNYPWHPHADLDFFSDNNTLYIPANSLCIGGDVHTEPGFGTLQYKSSQVLTKTGSSRSRWEILDWFHNVTISHHSRQSIKNGFFQSAMIGQEFVVSENQKVNDWAKAIIMG